MPYSKRMKASQSNDDWGLEHIAKSPLCALKKGAIWDPPWHMKEALWYCDGYHVFQTKVWATWLANRNAFVKKSRTDVQSHDFSGNLGSTISMAGLTAASRSSALETWLWSGLWVGRSHQLCVPSVRCRHQSSYGTVTLCSPWVPGSAHFL